MTLPPFSGLEARCPKCGAAGMRMLYVRSSAVAPYGSLAYRAADEVFPCMERTCATCHFQALEAPLSPSDAPLLPQPTMQADGVNDL